MLGKLRAADVDTALIRKFVETKIREEMNRTTIGLCIRCLSTFYSDLCERPSETGATHNPVAGLPRSLRRLYKSQHDKRLTPYVRQLADVIRLYQAFERPFGLAYAIGSFAGLRTGEIPALEWERIDLDVPRIEVNDQIQNGQRGPLKDDEARILQGEWLAPLVPVLREWKLQSGGRGLVFPPTLSPRAWQPHGCVKRKADFLTPAKLYRALAEATAACGMSEVMEWDKPWYQATRQHIRFALGRERPSSPAAGRYPRPQQHLGDGALRACLA